VNKLLANVIGNPGEIEKIPREQIPALLLQISSLQAALAANMISGESTALHADFQEPESDGLITVEEASRKLSLTEQYVYGLLKAGDIPPVKCGKYVRIRVSDLNAWVEKHIELPIDNNLYHRYSRSHGRNRTSKNQKITWAHSRTDGRQDRREIKHRGAMGAGRVTDIRTRSEADSPDRTDRDEPKVEA
jgi:excisionase family DNA binding protein